MDIDERVIAHHDQELIVHQWWCNRHKNDEDLSIPDFVDYLRPQSFKDLRLIIDYTELDACYSSYRNFHY